MKGTGVKLLIYLIANSKIMVLERILVDIITYEEGLSCLYFKLPIEAKEAP